MAVKAKCEITLYRVVDIDKVTRYYLLQSSTATAPSKPTSNPPGGNWKTTEPSYTSGSTNTLYFVDLTVMTNGSFSYSAVSKSSSYEAAKEAWNKAQNAQNTANSANGKIDDLQIGGRNLLLYSANLKNGYYRHIYDIDDETFKGCSVFKVNTVWNGIQPYFNKHITERNVIKAGDVLTYSIYAKTDDTKDIYISMYNRTVDNNGGQPTIRGSQGQLKLSNDWKMYSITFTVTESMLSADKGLTWFGYEVCLATSSGKYVYFACPKLEKSSKPTDYTPAPEDTEEKISAVETVASATAGKFNWLVKSGTSSTDFTLTDRVASLLSDEINLKGLVKFSGLNSETQKKITDTQSAVDNLEIGGRNLLLNSSKYTKSTPLEKRSLSKDGYMIYKDLITSDELEVGQQYIIQAQTDGNWSSKHISNGADPSEKLVTLWLCCDKENACFDMRKGYAIFTPKYATKYWIRINQYSNDTDSYTVHVWDLKVEKGNKLTGWTCAPEDVNNNIDAIQKNVDDITIGGNNLLRCSGNFDDKKYVDFWSTNGGGLTLDTSTKYLGKSTLKSEVGNGFRSKKWYQVDTNKTYTYSAMVKSDAVYKGAGNMPLHYWCADNENNSPSAGITIVSYDQTISKTDTWTLLRLTFKPKGKLFRPFIYAGASSAMNLNIAYMKLEEGNKPTDWTPAIEDITQDATDKSSKALSDAKAYSKASVEWVSNNGQKAQNLYSMVSKWAAEAISDTTEINGGLIKAHTILAKHIDTEDLFAQNIIASGSIQSDNYAETDGIATVGSKWVLSDGTFKSKYLNWDKEGFMKATGGKIGGWNLEDSLYSDFKTVKTPLTNAFYHEYSARNCFEKDDFVNLEINPEYMSSIRKETKQGFLGVIGDFSYGEVNSTNILNGIIELYTSRYTADTNDSGYNYASKIELSGNGIYLEDIDSDTTEDVDWFIGTQITSSGITTPDLTVEGNISADGTIRSSNVYDSGWVDCNYGNGIYSYDNNSWNQVQVRKVNGTVFIRGVIGNKTTWQTHDSLLTFPKEYAPQKESRFVMQGSGSNRWLLVVRTDGICKAERYSNNTTTSNTVPLNSWLNVFASWPAK